MNNLNILLIDEGYIKNNSIIMNDVEDGFFRSAIFESQNMELQTILEEDFYTEIIEQFEEWQAYLKTGGTDPIEDIIEPRILKLVDNYIQPILLYYTLSRSALPFYAKITNKSMEKQESSNAYPVDLIVVEKYKKQWSLNGEHYITEITKFLTKNADTYPEYKTAGDCDVDGNRASNYSSMYLGEEL